MRLPSITNTRRLSLLASLLASLFAVRMLVAPLPIISLVSSPLLVVRPITSMVLHQVAPIRPIFPVIPIMVIAMMRVIDS